MMDDTVAMMDDTIANIEKVIEEVYDLQDKMSDRCYLTVVNLLRDRYNLEQQRLMQQRLEQQRLEQQRLEQQRLEQLRLEQLRMEQLRQRHLCGFNKYIDYIGPVCYCDIKEYEQSDKTKLYEFVPLLRCIESNNYEDVNSLIVLEFDQYDDIPVDVSIAIVNLLLKVKKLDVNKSKLHELIYLLSTFSYIFKHPEVLYKYNKFRDTVYNKMCKFYDDNYEGIIVKQRCDEFNIINPFDTWKKIFEQKYFT
jgi:hypothetical protein